MITEINLNKTCYVHILNIPFLFCLYVLFECGFDKLIYIIYRIRIKHCYLLFNISWNSYQPPFSIHLMLAAVSSGSICPTIPLSAVWTVNPRMLESTLIIIFVFFLVALPLCVSQLLLTGSWRNSQGPHIVSIVSGLSYEMI